MENTKNEEQQQDQLEIVEDSLGKTEQFIEENQNKLLTAVAVVVLIILGVWAYSKFIKGPKEERAASQMFQAEAYFEMDSVSRALNGDANYPGFLQIINQFSGTKAANNAKYYAGACYMRLGEFNQAIKMLDDFSSSDPNLAPIAKGLQGDAYMELGQTSKAIDLYKKAADMAEENVFVAPIYLQKLGVAYEKEQKYSDALKAYETLLQKYPKSNEGMQAEKNVKAMQIKLGK